MRRRSPRTSAHALAQRDPPEANDSAELVFQIFVNNRRIVNDHCVVNQCGNLSVGTAAAAFMVANGYPIGEEAIIFMRATLWALVSP